MSQEWQKGRRVGDIRRESGERERDLQRAKEVEGKGKNVQVQNQQEWRGGNFFAFWSTNAVVNFPTRFDCSGYLSARPNNLII